MPKSSFPNRLGKRVQTPVSGESRTQQHFADDCDVNSIIHKYTKTNVLKGPMGRLGSKPRQPQFGDFSTSPDYQESLNTIIDAQEHFESLPSQIRRKFKNDPLKFLEFMDNPKNVEEAIELGLAVKISDGEKPSETPKTTSKQPEKAAEDPSASSSETAPE